MAKPIKITLPETYKPITEKDIRKAKDFILRREDMAYSLQAVVSLLLEDAAAEIVQIAYSYNIPVEKLEFTASCNKKLDEAVNNVLDTLEDNIIDYILQYSLRNAEDEERKKVLLPWILALGKGNRRLRESLNIRMLKFKRDIEAMVVAFRLAGMNVGAAVSKTKGNIYSVYALTEVRQAYSFSTRVQAAYIRSHGIKHGNQGNSSSEANNILRFARTTMQMAWMRNQYYDFYESGAIGYIQLRGSSYPCDICDAEANILKPIEGILEDVYPHCNCMCYRVPVYFNDLI